MNQLQEFRKQKDQYFHRHAHSPLTAEQKAAFKGLNYFPENPALRFELEIEEFEEQAHIQMQTSTGDLQNYTRFGKVKFQVGGENAELTLYSGEHGFFLPFVDSQAGEITYGAGRYLEPEALPNGKLLLDFNMAYNPFCAYNENFSCPLPPAENRLSIAIQAGEKNFK
ncbi:MAG: DUF1684 domain-containing protein [Anaerolineae bacterium]|nr:DUF1684 domain-containing protein [Anaerolineae bacterium]